MDTLPDVPMDWEPQITPQANVDTVQYGDGYEQRRPAGINYVKHQASVQWSSLTRDEFDQVYPFLKDRLSLTPFLWTEPSETTPRRWICDAVAKAEINARFWRVSATFREVMA
ncbi:phage tail protein [Salinicola corii]|uniref:Phage tail protein n=1 Tax=Salinicola corii TaxID=2606937 RepID=A0A640W916_9GAMM|nr:phage tail protein [Salinicola corii]KAA0015506.1 phage tail protein [Salinicola corii]